MLGEPLQLLHDVDESLFPPRCCRQPFPWELVRDKLSEELQTAFPIKRIELETQNRTYCYVATCSAFIKPDDYDKDKTTCPKCQSITCVKCKRKSHDGVCGEDGETEELLATARQNGWQRCSGCRRMVELNIGCNHMTYATLLCYSAQPLLHQQDCVEID